MEKRSSNSASLVIFTLLAGLISQNLVIPVISTTIEDQKNFYYSPDPHSGSPPSGSYGSPPSGSYGSPPSHGSSGGGHGSSSTPSHHGSSSSHGHGGGSYNPTPSTPSGGNCGTPPHDPNPTPSHSTPSTPSGGYYNSPPSYGGGSPSTPITNPPPTPIIDPGTPTIPTIPSPPTPFTGTCNYWRNHPGIIWGLLGWWGTLGNAFGVTSVPGFGASVSLPQALSNTRTDGLGALYREGTASFLNSLVNNKFPYTTKQVRDRFAASLSSNKAAAAQAQLFRMANEGRMKPQA